MVVDGYLYALGLALLAVLAAYLGGPAWAIPECLLAAFVLYFFRDPERVPPPGEWVVSPGDGRVVDLSEIEMDGQKVWKIGIFLNLFDVHVNRSPIAGIIRKVHYTPGKFLIASRSAASDQNEQNTVTIEGACYTVTFKQIAGLLARRIVFTKKVGDRVQCGERVGLIKFGSRVDIFLPLALRPMVAMGDRVKGGSTVVASLQDQPAQSPQASLEADFKTTGSPLRT
jgi:phosphatidylserine decarboxylase